MKLVRDLIIFFCMWIPSFSRTICWKDFLFTHWMLLTLCWNSLDHIYIPRCFFWILCSIPQVCMSQFMSVPHCCSYSSFVISCKIRNCESLSWWFFFRIVLALWGSLGFPYKFLDFIISAKKIIGILMGIALNL